MGSGWLTYSNISATLTPGTWNMVTTTVTNTGYSIYVNGASVGSVGYIGTPTLMTGTSDFLSMGYGANNVMMDEFQLYNSVLSAAQIQKVYQNQVVYFGSVLPANTPVQLASGATFDLNGSSQTIDSLANSAGGGGTSRTAPAARPRSAWRRQARRPSAAASRTARRRSPWP